METDHNLTCPLEFLDKSVCPSLPAKEDDESTIKKTKILISKKMKDISSLKNLPHYPVMLKEVLDTCNLKNGGLFVDCTYGAGGYSNAILSYPNTQVIALDRDPNIKRMAEKTKKNYKNRFFFHN